MERATQAQLAAELNHYLDAGATAMAEAEMLEPVAVYDDPAHLVREQQALFRRQPLVVGHRSQLPNPGDFLTEDLGGVPVVVVRQEDGGVRAFANVCRHRGARVVRDTTGNRRAFACPYHGWSYGRDGRLVGVPFGEGFCGIDRATYGLIEFPAAERHGLVWAQLTPGGHLDVAAYLGALDVELTAYGLDTYVVERTTLLREKINWKLVVDGFLEAYHLKFLHSGSIGPYIRTNVTPFAPFGAHGRMVAARNSFDAVRSTPPERIDLLPHIAVIYQIFPNTVLVWQGDHFESWLVFPEGGRPDRSASRVSLLTPGKPGLPVEPEHWDKNWKVLMDTVLQEDFPVARTMQQGFAAGVQPHVTYGRNEPALQHYHRQLRTALEAGEGREASR